MTTADTKQQQARHTPEPWRIVDDHLILNGDDFDVAMIKRLDCKREQEANALLIAAAPETAAERDRLRKINRDLLAALKGVMDAWALGHKPEGYAGTQARAAIAKAEER